jgi:hypothetical protein
MTNIKQKISEIDNDNLKKEITKLQERIEIWKKYYYTGQTAFCEHDDRVKEKEKAKVEKFRKELERLKVFPRYYVILIDKYNKIFSQEETGEGK